MLVIIKSSAIPTLSLSILFLLVCRCMCKRGCVCVGDKCVGMSEYADGWVGRGGVGMHENGLCELEMNVN